MKSAIISAIFFTALYCYTHGQTIHECQRVCQKGETPRKCVYDFHIEYYYTMSKACYACPHKLEDCDRPHCISADGVERSVIVVNRQLPGPSIQVCHGDEIIATVTNHLPGESCSIHWHGIHMVGTPYMDGVPLVTQCPITPCSSFQYKFIASNPGTHFWHSHSGFQRSDGVFGSLIVRQSVEDDPHASLYDFDLPEHVITVSDWLGELGVSKFLSHYHDDGDNKPTSMIINGRGRLPSQPQTNETMPLTRFQVTKGNRYRFRVISNGFLNCPIQISVDNHTVVMIASDGSPISPIEVDSFVIAAGERFDFVLIAIQPVSTYWIRLHGLMDCNVNRVFQAAILQYEGSPDAEPESILTYENTIRQGKTLNPVNFAPGDDQHVTIAELDALKDNKTDWTREPDHKFYLAYDFYAINNFHFHDPDHYPIFGVNKDHRVYTPQINHISLRMPSSPPLSQYDSIPPGTLCNHSTVQNCDKEFCHCTYTIQIPLGSLVELVLIDEGVAFDATHPFHVHGLAFRVVAMHRIGSNVTVDQIKEMDANGLIQRKLANAPLKDTVSVPDGGYTIVRFVATNPGYWLVHCHLSFHIEVGMGLVFKIGEHSDLPPIPKNFPTCGSWAPQPEEGHLVVTSNNHNYEHISTRHHHGVQSSRPSAEDAHNNLDNNLSQVLGHYHFNEMNESVSSVHTFQKNTIPQNQIINNSISNTAYPSYLSSSSVSVASCSRIYSLVSFSFLLNILQR